MPWQGPALLHEVRYHWQAMHTTTTTHHSKGVAGVSSAVRGTLSRRYPGSCHPRSGTLTSSVFGLDQLGMDSASTGMLEASTGIT